MFLTHQNTMTPSSVMDLHIIEIKLKPLSFCGTELEMFEAMRNFAERQNDMVGIILQALISVHQYC